VGIELKTLLQRCKVWILLKAEVSAVVRAFASDPHRGRTIYCNFAYSAFTNLE
jgi:hypothetical protein